MSVMHGIASYAKSGRIDGVKGMQSVQRDYSPFLVHFTSFAGTSGLRDAIRLNRTANAIKTEMENSDAASFDVVKLIATNNFLKVNPRLCRGTPRV